MQGKDCEAVQWIHSQKPSFADSSNLIKLNYFLLKYKPFPSDIKEKGFKALKSSSKIPKNPGMIENQEGSFEIIKFWFSSAI